LAFLQLPTENKVRVVHFTEAARHGFRATCKGCAEPPAEVPDPEDSPC